MDPSNQEMKTENLPEELQTTAPIVQKVTKEKSLGRILAGKKLAEYNKLHRWNKEAKVNILKKTPVASEVEIPTSTYRENKDPVTSNSNNYYYVVFLGFGLVGFLSYKYYKGKKEVPKQKPLKPKTTESKPVSAISSSGDVFIMQ